MIAIRSRRIEIHAGKVVGSNLVLCGDISLKDVEIILFKIIVIPAPVTSPSYKNIIMVDQRQFLI